MSTETQNRLSKNQRDFLKALDASFGNISAACKKTNLNRATYYKWMKNSPKFVEEVETVNEGLIDFAETKLHQNIMDGKEASIFFFLKTKGKKRGYVETVEQKLDINPFEELMKSASVVDYDEE